MQMTGLTVLYALDGADGIHSESPYPSLISIIQKSCVLKPIAVNFVVNLKY